MTSKMCDTLVNFEVPIANLFFRVELPVFFENAGLLKSKKIASKPAVPRSSFLSVQDEMSGYDAN